MTKNQFLNQAELLSQKAKFLNFMVMQIKKPENEGTLFRKQLKEKDRKRTRTTLKQDLLKGSRK